MNTRLLACRTYENKLKEKDNEIVSLEKRILQTKLEGKEESLSIAKTAKGTTNNIKNMLIFNIGERITQGALSNYTEKHLLQGASGTAKWIKDNIITDENGNKLYICSDKSREVFKFMNEKGEIVTDVKAEFLLRSINPKLIPIASEIKTKRVKEIIDMYNPEELSSDSGEIDLTKEQVKQEIKQLNDNDDKMFSERKKIVVAYKEAIGTKVSKELVKIV